MRVFMCQLIDLLPIQIRLKQVMKPFQTDKGKKCQRHYKLLTEDAGI